MAHSATTKAAVILDVLGGMSYKQASDKHGVAKSTVQEWVEDARGIGTESVHGQNHLPVGAEARKERFNHALDTFLMSTVTMLNAWAETCSDESFIRSNPSGVNELGTVVLDRADRLVSTLRRD